MMASNIFVIKVVPGSLYTENVPIDQAKLGVYAIDMEHILMEGVITIDNIEGAIETITPLIQETVKEGSLPKKGGLFYNKDFKPLQIKLVTL